MKKLAIFASGSGTNAQRIMEFFRDSREAEVALVLSNKQDAFVLERAVKFGVPIRVFDRYEFYETTRILDLLLENDISLIVLAGFLWMVPDYILKAFPGRIINIHPALLPKYGGKGLYGMKVHDTVIREKEKESGISIHYVNEKYDEGEIIFQARCSVDPSDTPETLASKIHELEYRWYPEVILDLVRKL